MKLSARLCCNGTCSATQLVLLILYFICRLFLSCLLEPVYVQFEPEPFQSEPTLQQSEPEFVHLETKIFNNIFYLSLCPWHPLSTVLPQPSASLASPWLSVTDSRYTKYCSSEAEVQVMDGAEPVREAVTHPLTLSAGDVITFQARHRGFISHTDVSSLFAQT